MKAKRLISTNNLSKEEWLQARRKGITASQLGAIMQVSKWDSPMSIYLDKIGEAPLEKEDNEFMEWGRRLECIISDKFSELHPEFKVQKVNAILYNPELPILLGDIDRLIIDKETKKQGVLEIKTVTEYGKDQWDGEEIPPSYILQACAYMYILDVDFAYFACLCGGHHYVEKRIERDNELIELILNAVKDFWQRVETKNPPVVDGSEASSNVLAVMYPEAAPGTEIDLDTEAEALCEQREALKQQEKELETQINEIDNRLKQKLGECELGMTEHFKIKWSNIVKNTFDSKKLKSEHEDLYKQYLKPSTYRKLDIRPVKKMEA